MKSREQLKLEQAALNLVKWLENDEQFVAVAAADCTENNITSAQYQAMLVEDLRVALHEEMYA